MGNPKPLKLLLHSEPNTLIHVQPTFLWTFSSTNLLFQYETNESNDLDFIFYVLCSGKALLTKVLKYT